MADLRVNFCGVELKNPITTASGTFGFGHEYGEFFDLSQLGGIGVKGLTPTERLGNPAPRIAETPQGILNCVGLQNPGIDRFIEEQIPFLRQYDTKIIANVSGNTVEEYEGMVDVYKRQGRRFESSQAHHLLSCEQESKQRKLHLRLRRERVFAILHLEN